MSVDWNTTRLGADYIRTNRDKTIGLSLFAAAIVTSALLK